jgi:hypothetical protein
VLRDAPRDRHVRAIEGVHVLRPELQPELLSACRETHGEQRSVSRSDDPLPGNRAGRE